MNIKNSRYEETLARFWVKLSSRNFRLESFPFSSKNYPGSFSQVVRFRVENMSHYSSPEFTVINFIWDEDLTNTSNFCLMGEDGKLDQKDTVHASNNLLHACTKSVQVHANTRKNCSISPRGHCFDVFLKHQSYLQLCACRRKSRSLCQ